MKELTETIGRFLTPTIVIGKGVLLGFASNRARIEELLGRKPKEGKWGGVLMSHKEYGLTTRLELPYEEAVERTKAALQAEGFGILTEIDIKATLKQKLNADFRKYVILGACNPPLAHRALWTELEIGLLLPCNVIVYEEDGGAVVSAIDPLAAMSIAESPALEEVATTVNAKLRRVVETLRGE